MTRLLVTITIAGAALMAAACSDTPPASPAPPGGGGETITGRERLGWVQPVASAAELALYQYAVYVNGIRRLLENASCSTSATADGFACAAPLPALSPGRHTLELAAFLLADGGTVVEGPRSAPLQVTVAGSTPSAGLVLPERVITADGLAFDVAILADDLVDPVDLAVAGEDLVVVAERTGVLRLIRHGAGASSDRPAENVLDLFRRDADGELLSLALPADFDRTGLVYLAIGISHQDGTALHIGRARALRGLMGEAAVLSTHQVPAEANAVLRIGPDRHLYVGVGTGIEPAAAQHLSLAAGKILRLRDDGGAAEGNPWDSTVWSVGHRDPRGLAWQGTARTLWAVERDDEGDEVNLVRPGANYGWPIVRGSASHPHVTRPSFILPSGTNVSGVTALPPSSSPLAGSLIVAGRGPVGLLRVRLDTGPRHAATSSILREELGEIGQVAAGADGSLYLITANARSWGIGRDMLVRLSLAPAAPLRPRMP